MPSTEKSPEFYKHYPALFHTYEVSFEQYSSLADDKSAFGKIAIDSLWVQRTLKTRLCTKNYYCHIAIFQYLCLYTLAAMLW